MRLEEVTAELRPRSDWEAVDLGLALARRDFWRLFACWWLGMLPVVVLCFAFLREHPILLLLACWWWVPVGSRLVLFVLSRHLFGELPSWKAVFHEWPRATFRRFFFRLFWARFSPWRPLTMAVEDLEGLRGKDYAQRVRLLLRRGDATVVALALWRIGLTFWLAGAVLFTEKLFLPQPVSDEWDLALSSSAGNGWLDLPPVLGWSITASFLLSMSLVDVFSTGAGFGIYVNHRTWIEGWDVELAFKRLANRLRGAGAPLLALLLFFGAASFAKGADKVEATPKERIEDVKSHKDFEVHKVKVPVETTPKERIEDVKSHKDFEVHKVKVPVPTASSSSTPSANLGWLGYIIMVLGYTLLGAVIAFVIWMLWRFRHILNRRAAAGSDKRLAPVARVVMGMDVAPESLPKDIPTAAMELWRVGRRQEALGLLYRGAISRLIEGNGVEIAESDTESDCVRRVSAEAAPHAPYFGGLTDAWMLIAYGRVAPRDEAMVELCQRWPFPERRSA